MRKLLFVSLLVICTSIIGCSDIKDKSKAENYVNSVELEFDFTENEKDKNQMELVYKEYDEGVNNFTFSIYRNVVTDVLYLWADDFRAGGLQEMNDPETGLPLTYEKYKELYLNSR